MSLSRLVALCVGCCFVLMVQQTAAEPSETEAKTKLEQVKRKIQTLQKQLRSTEGKREEQSQTLQQMELQIGALARRIRVTGQSLKRQQRRLSELEGERADARLRLDQHRSSLQSQLRAAYAMGRQEKMKILLNQQDPAVVSRVMVYYDYFNKARLVQMEQIRAGLQKLNMIEQKIAREEQRLQQLQSKNLTQKQQLEAAQSGRKKIIASLNSRLKNKGQELQSLKTDEKQLQSLLEEIRQALVDIPINPTAHVSFQQRKGKLPWPSSGKLVASFGTTRELGKLKWDGVLISAPEGQEVRAIHHGRVAFADWLRGFGLLLIIDHGEGFMSLYGHNQSLFKETGEWVEPGEVVAQVGSSGGRSSSGVYFGIRHNGKPKNPTQWCRRIRGRVIAGKAVKELSFYPVTHNTKSARMALR